MNKKIFIITLVIIIIIIGIVLGVFLSRKDSNNNTIVMVTEAGFAPYEYYEDGKIVGIDVEIAEEIAKALNKKLEIKDVEFDSILNEVKFGRADFAAAGLTITKERAEEVDFTIEYTKTKQVIIVPKDSNIKAIEDIKEKTVSIQTGSLPDLYISEEYPNVNIIHTSTISASIADIKAGKADFTATDELPAKEIIRNNPDLIILEEPLVENSFGIAVKKGNTELLNQINDVLDKLIQEGKIEEYTLKYNK